MRQIRGLKPLTSSVIPLNDSLSKTFRLTTWVSERVLRSFIACEFACDEVASLNYVYASRRMILSIDVEAYSGSIKVIACSSSTGYYFFFRFFTNLIAFSMPFFNLLLRLTFSPLDLLSSSTGSSSLSDSSSMWSHSCPSEPGDLGSYYSSSVLYYSARSFIFY